MRLIAPKGSSAVVVAEALVLCGEAFESVGEAGPVLLSDGGRRIETTAAAALYLARTHPGAGLFSDDGLELIALEGSLSLILRQIAAGKSLTEGDSTGIFYAGLTAFESAARALEARLSLSSHMAGEAWTLLDSYVAWFFSAVNAACPLSRSFPHLERLTDEAAHRPSVQRALNLLGEDTPARAPVSTASC